MADTRARVMAFLAALDEAIPPPPHCMHYIGLPTMSTGERRLTVWVVKPDRVAHAIFIDDGDLEKPPEALARECLAILAATA
jgi:hypothetical protein